MRAGATRRDFLAALGAAGAAVGVEGTSAGAARAATRGGEAVDFYGVHQAGITTPCQEHLQFLSLDMVGDEVSDLRGVLETLSEAAALMTRGRPVGPLNTGVAPPVDTGEAVGLSASRLTVTVGLGPAVFAPSRFGLGAQRPAPLIGLPAFANDALQHKISGGDIGIQVCAEDPQVTFHAMHDLIRLASPAAVPRWSLAGFGGTLNARGAATPRNLMGFKDGTANIMREERAALDRFVWAGAPESSAWMHGGSYMVVRRIQMLMGNWDSIGLDQQEATFGRHKISGAPLGRSHEYDPLDLKAHSHGQLDIPRSAHVRLASPEVNDGQRILRRGYSYVDGVTAGAAAGGQLFICYQRDPRRQFVRIQQSLARADALGAHTRHIGSAIFACPPGAGRDGFVGEGLFS